MGRFTKLLNQRANRGESLAMPSRLWRANPFPPANENAHPKLKGKQGGNCNRTACQLPNAYYYNTGTGAYYCDSCAYDIGTHDMGLNLFPHLKMRFKLSWGEGYDPTPPREVRAEFFKQRMGYSKEQIIEILALEVGQVWANVGAAGEEHNVERTI